MKQIHMLSLFISKLGLDNKIV
ncbi:hypothetical protein AGR7B_Cc120005 [Agrobacterium deltaense RV3]|nr:hypothetical protein AGR7B_Cc120005 [Agrobacterium deltaense RV3]